MTSAAPAPADVQGLLIAVGATVAFATLSYRRAELRIGMVVEIDTDRRDSVRVYELATSRSDWRRPSTLVTVA